MKFKAAITTILLSVGLMSAVAGARAAPAGKSSSPQSGPLIEARRDARFLEGLRQRRLFELAEKHCQDLLADTRLDEHRRAEATIELSRTLAQHALESPPADQAALWRRARAVVDEFAKAHPQSPQLLLVRAQGALAALLQGEEGRDVAQFDSRREALDEARQVLRVACDQLRKLQADVAAAIKRQPRGVPPTQDQLSTAQLLSLEMHVRHELARGLTNQGLCYPAHGADRVNSLTQALELLKSLAQQELEPTLAWSVSLDTVAALRALDDYPAAQRALAALEKTQPPPELAPRLRVERIRLALARGQVDEALSEAGRGGPRPHADWAPAEYAQLEAYTTAWRNARQRRDAAEAARWERTAMDQVRAIEQVHGPRWSRKAENLLANAIAASGAAPSAPLLMRLAGSYYRGGRIDEALAAYDRASATARQAGDAGAAFDAALAAATIERERNALRSAIDRYRKLAIEWPRNAKASEAHLLAVHAAAQVAAAQQSPQLDEYKQLLDEHVANWPTAATAAQAWCWLGRLAEHEHRPRDALSAFRHVNPNHPQHAEAIEAAGRSYAQLIAESRGQDAEHERLASEAVSYFESLIAADAPQAKDNPSARAAVLAAARVALSDRPDGAAKAEALLSKAIARDSDAPPEWKAAARGLLVAALASRGRIERAEKVLEQIPIHATADALAVSQLLGDARGRSSGEAARKLAGLELTVLDDLLLARDRLDAKSLGAIKRQRAMALATAGRRREALAALRSLAVENPRDGQTQEDLAVVLAGGSRDSQQAAVEQWRLVASKSRPGSPRWFRAQYGLARAQLDLGDAQQASTTIKLVAAAHPELGGPPMKASFEQLLAACLDRSPAARGRLGSAQ
jgi:hypothetical protein